MSKSAVKLKNYIGGEFREACSGEWLEHYAPATGKLDYWIASSGAEDIEQAVKAAKGAAPAWAERSAEERASVLLAMAQLIEDNLEELAALESADQGKPVWLARQMDIPRAALNFRFFASAITHSEGVSTEQSGKLLSYTLRRPHGVVGLISPWNLPLYLLTWKMAPALAAGNALVAKPSELTSRTAVRFFELIESLDLPPGLVNLVLGSGALAGDALVRHPQVPAISFTGGTLTGQKIIEASAPQFKRLSLELGGKNANIIFADADLEKAVETSVRSSFLNQGEICLCGSRILVQEEILEEFTQAFTQRVRALRVGDPSQDENFLGALVSAAHHKKVLSYLELAREEGGEILCGGQVPALPAPFDGGYFLEPTVIRGLGPSCRVFQEEIFGPVVTLHGFRDEAEALTLARNSAYGLSASLWTRDLSRAHRLAGKLGVGTVWINTWMQRDLRLPFGGVGASGIGREGGRDSLNFFTETTAVSIRMEGDSNK